MYSSNETFMFLPEKEVIWQKVPALLDPSFRIKCRRSRILYVWCLTITILRSLASQCLNEKVVRNWEHHYRLQPSCGKVMFLHLSVILFTGEGVCQTPPGRHPSLYRHPPGQTPPSRHPWEDTPSRRPLQWTVRILLECILVHINIFSSFDSWGQNHRIPELN